MAERNLAKVPDMEYENNITDYNFFSSSISTLNEIQRPHLQYLNYYDYIKGAVWSNRRELYIDHYLGKCQLCGKKPITLQLHHVNYNRVGVEALDDLKLICKPCHTRQHNEDYIDSYH